MSAALFEREAGGRHEADSAGTTPGDRVHPEAVEVMRELGIDLSDRTPRKLTTEAAERSDVVVTMGCGDECPYIPGKRYVDWDLEDPKGRPVEEVRATRDEIDRRVRELVEELETGLAFRDGLRELGLEAELTSDHPLDRFSRGDIALRVPAAQYGDATVALDGLDL